jgi:GTPase involved in cell partitioning and DNA repair
VRSLSRGSFYRLRSLLLRAVAGRGGAGCVSFARARFRRVGPPDGGSGGNGGSAVIQTSASVNALPSYRHVVVVRAEDGAPGERRERQGRRGTDVRFVVPPGTWLRWMRDPETVDRARVPVFLNLNDTAVDRRVNETVRALAALEPTWLPAQSMPAAEGTTYSGSSVMVASASSQAPVEIARSVVAAAGGQGGRGNAFYKSSVNRSPRHAQSGLDGEEQLIKLEQVPTADVALVGVPNAGKSSLMATLTRARPMIAPYAYSTREPVLGVLEDHETWSRSILVEIPAHALEHAQKHREEVWHLLRACRHVVAVIDKHIAASGDRQLGEQVALLQRMVAPRILAACVSSPQYPEKKESVRSEMPRLVQGVPFLTRLSDVRKMFLDLTNEPPSVDGVKHITARSYEAFNARAG